MRALSRALVALAAILLPASVAAASDTPKPLFASSDTLHLTITGPAGRLAANRSPQAPPIDATLRVDGLAPETLPVKLSIRGITRRASDICQFPPILVTFADKPAAGSIFKGQKKLKLVTQCRAAAAYQQYLLLEYAAYRMFNLLTPASFNVRLATIDYVEAAGRPAVPRPGFFIEDGDDVAHRNGTTELKTTDRIPIAALSPVDAARAAVFEYMIGNLDWAMTAGPAGTRCCHNFKLLGNAGTIGGVVPLPYDYDFSGLVGAPYATPPDGIGVTDVHTRKYRGYCRFNPGAQAAAADMLVHRAALLATLDSTPGLDEKTRGRAASYLGHFFDQIATARQVDENLLKTCIN